MTPGIKKWILKPLLILFITFSLLAGIGILLLMTQQQRLVNVAVGELNNQLGGELTIEESSISLFKNFPYVSIALHNARFFADKSKMGRQLCEFDRLYVGFSLTDIFQKKYNVRRLSLQGGFIALTREPDGRINIIDALKIKPDTIAEDTKIDTSGFEIDLQKMELKELEVSFLDRSNGKRFITHVDNLSSSFSMHTHQLAMVLNGDMLLDLTSPTDTSFFRHKKFSLELDAAYETATKLFKISSCNIKLNDATFKVMGTTMLSDHAQVDFVVMGEKPDFNLMSAFLPGDVKEALKPFRYDGRVHFQGVVSGHVSKDRMPLIEVSFGCEDGYFQNTSANRKVDQLGFQGYYTNGSEHNLRTSELHLTNINARPERGVFKGNFILHDFTDPHTLVQIESELELKFIGEFLGIPRLKQSTGHIRLHMNFKELDNIELPEQSLNKLREGIQSTLSVDGLSFDIPGYPHRIRDMNLHAEMKDGKVRLDSAFLRIGDSDFYLDGSLSDINGFLHDSAKTISVTLNARSKKVMLNQLLDYDTVLSKRFDEEITGFNIGLSMQTSVQQLLHPSPLPKGVLEVRNLNASFKNYAHVFKNLSATATVNDTLVRLKNLTGMIDSSDLQFSGRITNYQLWFDHVMKGKTQVAFDLKSKRFAFKDIFPKAARSHLPRGYRREELDDVWLRAKIDLRYDTVFKFAKAHISNVTGVLKRHGLKLKDITGYVKYGTNRVLTTDSLTGSIGRSDFDVTMRLYNGPDRNMKKRTNSFVFKSKMLDVDEINAYSLAPAKSKKDTVKTVVPDSLSHKNAFNIFMIPFSDFKVEIDVAKIKYNKLWLKDVSLRLRMQEDHYIYVDTLGMKVADGTVGMKGHLNGNDPDNIYFKSTINVDQVDLEKMLIKLDHLGQDVVINKNVKGRLSGIITSDIQVHPNLVPIMSKTKADLNVVIYNGSLVDFAPMQAMASYFKDKNLRMIRFDTLKNDFSFTNGTLDIPTMTINSSIGFMQISGKQSLDLKMEYYIRVPIKMVTKAGFNSLFAGKPEEINMDQVDEIEYLDKDKRIRFMNLKVTGKPGDFSVGLGKDKRSN